MQHPEEMITCGQDCPEKLLKIVPWSMLTSFIPFAFDWVDVNKADINTCSFHRETDLPWPSVLSHVHVHSTSELLQQSEQTSEAAYNMFIAITTRTVYSRSQQHPSPRVNFDERHDTSWRYVNSPALLFIAELVSCRLYWKMVDLSVRLYQVALKRTLGQVHSC